MAERDLIQIRRGTLSAIRSDPYYQGQLFWATDTKELYIQDKVNGVSQAVPVVANKIYGFKSEEEMSAAESSIINNSMVILIPREEEVEEGKKRVVKFFLKTAEGFTEFPFTGYSESTETIIKNLNDEVEELKKKIDNMLPHYILEESDYAELEEAGEVDQMGVYLLFEDGTLGHNGITGDLSYTVDFNDWTITFSGIGVTDDYTVSALDADRGEGGWNSPFYKKEIYKHIIFESGVTYIGRGIFPWITGDGIHDLQLPNTLTEIGDAAFFNTYIEVINFPEGLTTLGKAVFDNNVTLREVTLPSTVTAIGKYCFQFCTSLEKAVIHSKVISQNCFGGCGALNDVTIGVEVTSIGNYAFIYDYNLSSIQYEGTLAQWNSITKGANWDGNTPGSGQVPPHLFNIYCTDGHLEYDVENRVWVEVPDTPEEGV